MTDLQNGGAVDVRLLQQQFAKQEAELAQHKSGALKGGDGGGTSGIMDGRVSRLEAHMEHVREDMREIKQSLSAISGKLERLGEMPTKGDLSSWKLQWTALAFAVVAIVIGGIIGGLAWIQSAPEKPSPAQPIVISVPAK